jgi:hypothetical protein
MCYSKIKIQSALKFEKKRRKRAMIFVSFLMPHLDLNYQA